ncbi:MAG: tRNA glutamyl-Q(34) synthetase GluQRS [Pseudomonadota bacterium]
MIVERFAPSPTGYLHLGHAFSAWVCHRSARAGGGQFLLRMEDLDTSRVRPDYYDAIEEDLQWLGLDWDGEIIRQTERQAAYDQAVSRLWALGVLYRCACTRRDIQEALAAPQEGSVAQQVYPGTCRQAAVDGSSVSAVRLNLSAAIEHLGGESAVERLPIVSTGDGCDVLPAQVSARVLFEQLGDIVIVRRDGVPAYHLSVVVDDAHQGVTHVTRGSDLAEATHIQRVLQELLDLPAPIYRHHRLIRDEAGKRLAKRDDARAIRSYREAGMTPGDVFALMGITVPVA